MELHSNRLHVAWAWVTLPSGLRPAVGGHRSHIPASAAPARAVCRISAKHLCTTDGAAITVRGVTDRYPDQAYNVGISRIDSDLSLVCGSGFCGLGCFASQIGYRVVENVQHQQKMNRAIPSCRASAKASKLCRSTTDTPTPHSLRSPHGDGPRRILAHADPGHGETCEMNTHHLPA